MAEFKLAYQKTADNEGGYSNDPVDAGGETWRGVARKFWPKWPGWQIVDMYKGRADFIRCLETNAQLQGHVLDFYKAQFWDKIKGDKIVSQDAANSIYDSAVNMGVQAAVKLAQRALNIKETGVVDTATLAKLNNV